MEEESMALQEKWTTMIFCIFSLVLFGFMGPAPMSGVEQESFRQARIQHEASLPVERPVPSAPVQDPEALHRAHVEERIAEVLSRFRTGLKDEAKQQIPRAIYDMGKKYGYDPLFLTAVIITESSFYNWAKSNRDALGLMQIRPRTGKAMAKETQITWRGRKTLFNPETNIALGTYYLNKLFRRFGNIEVALEAYNHGPTQMARYLRRGYQPEKYSGIVLRHYNAIRLPESRPRAVFAVYSPQDKATPKVVPAVHRPASKPATPQAVKTVSIQKGETLLKLANRLGYHKKEAIRFAAALWMSNVDSFTNGNMNGIQAGQALNLDRAGEKMKSLEFTAAKQMLQKQWQDWKRYINPSPKSSQEV